MQTNTKGQILRSVLPTIAVFVQTATVLASIDPSFSAISRISHIHLEQVSSDESLHGFTWEIRDKYISQKSAGKM